MIQFFLSFNEWAILILRVVFGLILISHGWPKIKDFAGKVSSFADMGFKPGKFWVAVAVLVEFVGGIAILIGFLTQIFALLAAVQFIVLLLTVHRSDNLRGKKGTLLLMAATALMLATTGSGVWGVDNLIGILIY